MDPVLKGELGNNEKRSFNYNHQEHNPAGTKQEERRKSRLRKQQLQSAEHQDSLLFENHEEEFRTQGLLSHE